MIIYKRIIALISTLVFFVSCNDKANLLLPTEYKLLKEKEIVSHPDKITVYEIVNTQIEYTEIKNYPKYDTVDYSLQKWISITELDEDTKKHITLVVEEISERINEENKNMDELVNVFKDGKNVYFSGIYRETKSIGNQTYNFYDAFSILDVSGNSLYLIEHMKGY